MGEEAVILGCLGLVVGLAIGLVSGFVLAFEWVHRHYYVIRKEGYAQD